MACLFCEMTEDRIIDRNDLAYSIRDGFPVTRLHTLIIPKRHAVDYFDLTKEELLACDELLKKIKQNIQAEDTLVDGFNIGMNAGPSAGQTVFHCHTPI